MAALCAFCNCFQEHSHHGVMPGNAHVLLLRICTPTVKPNVSCTMMIVPLALYIIDPVV